MCVLALSGGRTYLSLAGLRGASSFLTPSVPVPAFLASEVTSGGPLRLEVRGYRGPIEPLPPSLGRLRCSSVNSSVFVSAYAAAEAYSPPEAAQGIPSKRCSACRSSCYAGSPCIINSVYGNEAPEGMVGGLTGHAGQNAGGSTIQDQSGNWGSSTGAMVCSCCKSQGLDTDGSAELTFGEACSNSGDILVAAAPDLRALALLQSRGRGVIPPAPAPTAATAIPTAAATAPVAAAPTTTAANSSLGGYFFSSLKSPGGAFGVPSQGPRGSSSSNAGPSVCSEWYFCMRLREGTGRVLLVSESLPSPSFGVLQQSSSICPSAFDGRKRLQWQSLPYQVDPFSAFTAASRSPHVVPKGIGSSKKDGSLLSSLPAVYPPSALSDAAAGALCGAPKLLVVTNRYVCHLRRQSIAQVYVKAIQSLSRDGPLSECPPNSDQQGHLAQYSSNSQLQQQQPRGMLVSVGPQRHLQWRHACLVTEQMCEDAHFGAGAMFAMFWQLLVDSTCSSAFPFSQSFGGSSQQVGPDVSPPSTNLLDKQLGALRSNRNAYFQPPGAPQMTQGSVGGSHFGHFETPFGLGYLDDSERQQQQQQSVGVQGGHRGGSNLGGAPAAADAAASRDGDGGTTALALAWRMLTSLEARREDVCVNSDLLREQLTLPVILQQPIQQQLQQIPQQTLQQHTQQQPAWGNGFFGFHSQPQQQQQGAQMSGEESL